MSKRFKGTPAGKAVQPCGRLAPDRPLLGGREPREILPWDRGHIGILAGEQADRPVAADHQPVRTECLEHDIEKGHEISLLPAVMDRLGHHPRHLAADIGMAGECPNVPRPVGDLTVGDRWLRQMIDHERLLGNECHQLERGR